MITSEACKERSMNQVSYNSPNQKYLLNQENVQQGMGLGKNCQGMGNTQRGMFQEFKIKYDELQKKNEDYRREVDELSRENKKLKVQLININEAYFQKQINRLRQQLGRVQQQNQENKHKLLCIENQKKEFQATARVKQQEVKGLLKQLQKEKVQCAQMKHQLTHKQQNYRRITEELQNSNSQISNSFQTKARACNTAEAQLKQKCMEVETLAKNLDACIRKRNELEDRITKAKATNEKVLQEKNQAIWILQKELREQSRQSAIDLEKVSQELSSVRQECRTQNVLAHKKLEEAQGLKEQHLLKAQITQLTQEARQSKLQAEQSKKIVNTLEQKLTKFIPPNQYQQLQENCLQLQNRLQIQCRNYEEQILDLQRKGQKERLDRLESQSVSKLKQNGCSFEEQLRKQLEEVDRMKQEIYQKSQEILRLKETVSEAKLKEKSDQNRMDILEKKLKSAGKNSLIEHEVQIQMVKNDFDSATRKLDTLQKRLDSKILQNKEKERFITNFIVGRSSKQDASLLLAELQRIFAGSN